MGKRKCVQRRHGKAMKVRADRVQRKAERETMGMLLGAKWDADLQVFVKSEPMPTEKPWMIPELRYTFFTRQGNELTGRDHEEKLKFHKSRTTRMAFTPRQQGKSLAQDLWAEKLADQMKSIIDNEIIDGLQRKSLTATALQEQIKNADAVVNARMQRLGRQLDKIVYNEMDHGEDALRYGMGMSSISGVKIVRHEGVFIKDIKA